VRRSGVLRPLPYLTSVPLTVGIDARAAAEEPAGRGRYVRELLEALARRPDPHRYLLYARSRWAGTLDDRFRWRIDGAADPLWNLRTARAASSECDVLLSSNSYLTVWFTTVPAVPVVYDLVTFDRGMRPQRRAALIERLTLGHAVRRAAGFLAISQSTADALTELFPRTAGRVTVTPLAVPTGLAAQPPGEGQEEGLGEGFVLAVGTLEPRKNLPRLMRAYATLPPDLQDRHPLVVVGKTGWEASETLDAVRGLGERCRLLGYVPDERLAQLYGQCTVFCYPSLGEGFGLPVLEAMHAGAAVVTSDRSSLPEVGGDAVEYVDPFDEASIAAGIERLLRDPGRRAELSERAALRARSFSWDRTAELTLGALELAA
jgi:glycosyltransferase involved in cell wall biosynthesis